MWDSRTKVLVSLLVSHFPWKFMFQLFLFFFVQFAGSKCTWHKLRTWTDDQLLPWWCSRHNHALFYYISGKLYVDLLICAVLPSLLRNYTLEFPEHFKVQKWLTATHVQSLPKYLGRVTKFFFNIWFSLVLRSIVAWF